MIQLSPEEITQLDQLLGLQQRSDIARVRDGLINKLDTVWWRNNEGPLKKTAAAHWDNIKAFPEFYQIAKPQTQLIYLD